MCLCVCAGVHACMHACMCVCVSHLRSNGLFVLCGNHTKTCMTYFLLLMSGCQQGDVCLVYGVSAVSEWISCVFGVLCMQSLGG